MQHPFVALQSEYAALLSRVVITRPAEINLTAGRLLKYIDAGHYKRGCDETGVPQPVAAASFEREAGSNFNLSPAQGDPWSRPSVHVPAHRGPFANWTLAQIDAYKIDGLEEVGAANWSWERACYEEELFNGFGYRARGLHSPYLWGGTNVQQPGKFTSDNHFDPSAMDTQLGVVPMMLRLVQMRPVLALPVPLPAAARAETVAGSKPAPVPPPAPVPLGHHDAAALQTALNRLGASPPLDVDDNFGKQTWHAVRAFQFRVGLQPDGIAGPATWTAITARLTPRASA